MPGYVYVLINPSIQGMLKIGMTHRDVNERIREISSATGVVMPFICIYKEHFNNCILAEKKIHELLRKYRVCNNREFFKVEPEIAIKTIIEYKSGVIEEDNNIVNDTMDEVKLEKKLQSSILNKKQLEKSLILMKKALIIARNEKIPSNNRLKKYEEAILLMQTKEICECLNISNSEYLNIMNEYIAMIMEQEYFYMNDNVKMKIVEVFQLEEVINSLSKNIKFTIKPFIDTNDTNKVREKLVEKFDNGMFRIEEVECIFKQIRLYFQTKKYILGIFNKKLSKEDKRKLMQIASVYLEQVEKQKSLVKVREIEVQLDKIIHQLSDKRTEIFYDSDNNNFKINDVNNEYMKAIEMVYKVNLLYRKYNQLFDLVFIDCAGYCVKYLEFAFYYNVILDKETINKIKDICEEDYLLDEVLEYNIIMGNYDSLEEIELSQFTNYVKKITGMKNSSEL